MKKVLKFSVFVLFIVSCSKPISKDELTHLNGYWEISEVKTADGNLKEFMSNNNVDLFTLSENQGTRVKVVPQLDGKNRSNGIQEKFVVLDSANSTYLKYSSNYAKWVEKVDRLTKDELVVVNENDIKYIYKRYIPININE